MVVHESLLSYNDGQIRVYERHNEVSTELLQGYPKAHSHIVKGFQGRLGCEGVNKADDLKRKYNSTKAS